MKKAEIKNVQPLLQQHNIRRSIDCPMCLFSSGIVADGKGTKCRTCGGVGSISKAAYNRLVDDLGDIIG